VVDDPRVRGLTEPVDGFHIVVREFGS